MASIIPSSSKQLIRKFLPGWALRLKKVYLSKSDAEYERLSAKEVFTKIYEEGIWGNSVDPLEKFYSGPGSHSGVVVDTYVEAVKKFILSLDKKPDIVDLGCGDFSVGSKIRPLCANYVACDIVEPVIQWNKEKYKDQNVDFRVLDITRDELPEGDVVFIRQVLQHLSNEQISRALPKIASRYKYLVLSEHLPAGEFAHNLDKPTGPGIRLDFKSGVVLTSPPFNLQAMESIELCEVAEFGDDLIKTTAYRFK